MRHDLFLDTNFENDNHTEISHGALSLSGAGLFRVVTIRRLNQSELKAQELKFLDSDLKRGPK